MAEVRHLLPGLRATLGLLFLLLLIGCGADLRPHHKFSGDTMGTRYHITVVDEAEGLDAAALQAKIDARLVDINQSMSTYIEDSELQRFNAAPVDTWVPLSNDLFEVLLLSMEIGWISDGAFDVTVGPLVDLWGFGPVPRSEPPDAEALAAARAQVGQSALELDLLEQRARKKRPVQLDLSAVAKGYGVDMLAELLNAEGITDYMVEVGGEVRVRGSNPAGRAWRIGIEMPDAAVGQVAQALNLRDVALATSGDYRNYYEVDGQRYSHTIDPATGGPVRHNLASVTVVAARCAEADALATAIDVMGPERGWALVEERQLAAYLIVRVDDGFDVRVSPAMQAYMAGEK